MTENKPKIYKVMSAHPKFDHTIVAETIDWNSLRNWWHHVLRENGKYKTYAFILALPFDNELIQYLESNNEFSLISGNDCLVIALSENEVGQYSLNDRHWRFAAIESITKGHSVQIANYFDVKLNEFPIILIFRDIRSIDNVAISLNKLTTIEIAERMRLIFSLIHQSIIDEKDPLETIKNYHNNQVTSKRTQSIIGNVREFAGKTLEEAMKIWLSVIFEKTG